MIYLEVVYFKNKTGSWDARAKEYDIFGDIGLTSASVVDAENYETARVFIRMLLKECTNNNYLVHTELTYHYVGEQNA